MADTVAHPVRTLRELVIALEDAITLTLDNPKSKPVHRLRTTTRRIEAQLELLSLLPDLPRYTEPAKKARKLLRKLRRATGQVRDLDVQLELTQTRSQEASHLRSRFKHQRDEAAERLLDTIQKHHPKLIHTLETLLETLTPVEASTIPLPNLAQFTLHWYAHHTPATSQNTQQLHTIRKSAKLARYMAESASPIPNPRAPKTPLHSATRLARVFESLQQSGGEWHDWLTLSEIAHRELGSSSPLARSFTHHCEESLVSYQCHLKSLQKNLSLVPTSKA